MPLRLVLIEDHQALREGLELLLGREGIEVLGTAGSAQEGRKLVEQLDPDVALIDIRLGEDSGIDLTAQLVDADPERRIMLYTGSSEIDLLISGLGSGARGYALKDGAPSELTTALTTVAEGGTYVDPRLHPALLSRRATQTQKSLSKREREIMDLLAQGLTGEQVAERLFLSPETIKTHIRNAMNKLEALAERLVVFDENEAKRQFRSQSPGRHRVGARRRPRSAQERSMVSIPWPRTPKSSSASCR